MDACQGEVHLAVAAGIDGPDHIAAALAEVADIREYHQRKALKTGCRTAMENGISFTLPRLLRELEKMRALWKGKHDEEEARNAERLLNRLGPLEELDRLVIEPKTGASDEPLVTVLELSGVSPMRDMPVRFCLVLLWEEIRQGGGNPPYDTLLLDEMQNIKIAGGSALWCMLREARKFHVQMILCTQSLSSYDREQRAMLTQAGHQLFFRPPMADFSLVDKLLGGGWRDVLSRLGRGQALLVGNYRIGEGHRIASKPLVVQFQKGKPE